MQQARHRTKLKGEFLPTRIDKALVHAFPHLSRRLIRRCLDAGGVYLNQHRVRISSHLAFSGDVVDLHVPANGSYTPPKLLSPDILYESTQVVAVNKPPGLATQATKVQATTHLEAQVREIYPTARIVHRLDQETSGVIILAKDDLTAVFLAQQFKNREIAKEYLTLCQGIPTWQIHEERSYLSPISGSSGTVRVVKEHQRQARLAVTKFKLLAVAKNYPLSLLKCVPVTGRSHQIRAHLYHLGLPVLGDKKYGKEKPQLPPTITELTMQHHLLHASRIQFKDNTTRVTVNARIPRNFHQLLGILSIKRPM